MRFSEERDDDALSQLYPGHPRPLRRLLAGSDGDAALHLGRAPPHLAAPALPGDRVTTAVHGPAKELAMITCSLCHFEAELDDVALTLAAGRSICLRCFDRETGNSQPMPTALRRQLQAALAAAA